jgi:hypothetical protein
MRHILLTIAGLAIGTATFAQLEIRPLVGVNWQNLTDAPALSDWKSETGYQFGVGLMLGSQVYFQPGVQYMSTNTQLTTTVLGNTFESSLNTGYLRIPIQLGFRLVHPDQQPVVNPRIFGNFAANFATTATFNESGLGDVTMGTANFGVGAGIGLDVSIFFLEAGYDVGLNPVFDDDRFELDAKANILYVQAGVRLTFAR